MVPQDRRRERARRLIRHIAARKNFARAAKHAVALVMSTLFSLSLSVVHALASPPACPRRRASCRALLSPRGGCGAPTFLRAWTFLWTFLRRLWGHCHHHRFHRKRQSCSRCKRGLRQQLYQR